MNQSIIEQVTSSMNTIKDIQSASALLGWDQETYMPDGSARARAEQIATLDSLAHQHLTSDSSQKLAQEAQEIVESTNNHTQETRLLRLYAQEVHRAVKLPESLVHQTSKAVSLAHDSWKKARSESNFSLFADDLKQLLTLKSTAAELYGYEENRYDALLNIYEPGMKVSRLKPVFANLQAGTTSLLKEIEPVKQRANDKILYQSFPTDKQVNFARMIVDSLGFNFDTGRIDLSVHPFCTSFAPTDVRLTTRVFEHDVRSCLFGLIHEAGHGMYEQGFAPELARTFASDGASMGIHESQSLFWENVIARSEEFWQWALPLMKDYFPEQLSGVTPFAMYKAINTIEPSFIRIESDEITYNIHIIIRFEIENMLINEEIKVEDVPTVWNNKMQEYLGITPPDDSQGCLQDIHWSFGGFGYFPSYTLGKLYAAMFRKKIVADLPTISDDIRRGHFGNILQWLRTNIHQYGKTMTPNELVMSITGNELSEHDFIEYAKAKAYRVYELG
jgi:carboxypeptidase Taq